MEDRSALHVPEGRSHPQRRRRVIDKCRCASVRPSPHPSRNDGGVRYRPRGPATPPAPGSARPAFPFGAVRRYGHRQLGLQKQVLWHRGDVAEDDAIVHLPASHPGQRLQLIEMFYEDLPRVLVEGSEKVAGTTMADLLDRVGGYRGHLPHPFTDEEIQVSLEDWRGRDPESVWLYIAFVDEV